MVVLITGSCGFIGFSVTKYLLNKKIRVIGLDSMNSYYNVKLKAKRLSILKKNKRFNFFKIDIANKNKIFSILKNKKIDLIINFAAQPGVRYSIINPNSYIKNNILGFANILDFAKKKNLPLIYSSSSSVYGNSKKYPILEKFNLYPKNIYALTKKNNEELAEHYANQFNLKVIGLRFFTVFGEWGRPDMLILKYLICSLKNKKFSVYNNGNHFRDFTYIDDLCKMIFPIIKNHRLIDDKNKIFNVCTGKSIHLKKIINILKSLSYFKRIDYQKGLNDLEVLKTHGSNKKLLRFAKLKFKPTPIEKAIKKTFLWFKKNKNLF